MDLKSVIISEFRKTVGKAQERFAKELKTTADHIQLALGINPDGTGKYVLYNSYTPVRVLTIEQVLGVKIDLMGKAGMVEGFLQKVLPRLAEQKKVPVEKMRLLCIKKEEKQYLYLFNDITPVGEIELEDLISNEELMPG
jgi:hypothetical protein